MNTFVRNSRSKSAAPKRTSTYDSCRPAKSRPLGILGFNFNTGDLISNLGEICSRTSLTGIGFCARSFVCGTKHAFASPQISPDIFNARAPPVFHRGEGVVSKANTVFYTTSPLPKSRSFAADQVVRRHVVHAQKQRRPKDPRPTTMGGPARTTAVNNYIL